MLTPQDILDKRFVKAMIGGYDMPAVDEFLEAVSTDYNALYKENAILKGKLKVLVEKVEEYRSTEDAMRMALLTAQRMGEEITVEATRAKEEMLRSADEEVKTRLAEISQRISQEEVRLAAASRETAKFIELSQAIMRKHSEFLKKLESASQVVLPAPESDKTPVMAIPEPVSEPAAPVQDAEPLPPVMPTPAPTLATAPAAPPVPQNFELEDIAQEIGSAVEQMTIEGPDEQTLAQPELSGEDSSVASGKEKSDTIELPVTEEKTPDITPRPKFDFDDLKFGANFDSDE